MVAVENAHTIAARSRSDANLLGCLPATDDSTQDLGVALTFMPEDSTSANPPKFVQHFHVSDFQKLT
jgi:hypothetical protein